MIIWAATGATSMYSVAQPIRQDVSKKGGTFYLASCAAIDAEKSTVKLQAVRKQQQFTYFAGKQRLERTETSQAVIFQKKAF